jgi:membrane protein
MPLLSWRAWFGLLRETVQEWHKDNCLRLGASLAFYTLFSLAPLLLVTIAIAALAFGDDVAKGEVMGRVEGIVGADAAATLRDMVERASQPRSGLLATGVGLAMSALGASGVFGQLQHALNDIWDVEPAPGRGLRGLVVHRVRAFSMLLLIAFLLFVSLAAGAAVTALAGRIDQLFPGALGTARAADLLTSFGVTALLFALLFKVLPDLSIRWSDVAVGALVSALLFTVGRTGISWYLGRATGTSVYGAAGSLVALLLWIYYSSQLLFFGAEFTQVYARRYGSLRPAEGEGSLPSAPGPR